MRWISVKDSRVRASCYAHNYEGTEGVCLENNQELYRPPTYLVPLPEPPEDK